MIQQVTLSLVILLFATVAAFAANPKPLGVFGKWSAWIYADKERNHCFIYSTPTSAEPSGLDHGTVLFFLRTTLHKPSPTESSFQAGYKFAPDADIRLTVDDTAFQMFSSGNSAWLRDENRSERDLLRAVERGHQMTIDAMSTRGNKTKYRFSLDGVTKAMQKAQAACP